MIDKNNVPNEYFEPNLNFRSIGPQVSAANLIFVKLRSRSRSGEGQEDQSQAKTSSENSKLKDSDLSSTLFGFHHQHHPPTTNFFFGFYGV